MCDYKSFLPFAMDAMDMTPYSEIEEFGCAHVWQISV
jgi:hypothetical protein